jgi:hypothetical protein
LIARFIAEAHTHDAPLFRFRGAFMTSGKKRVCFVTSVAGAFVALIAVEHFYVSKLSFFAPQICNLDPLQEKQLQIFLEMNRLLTTLAPLVIGAMAAFMFQRYKTRDIPWYQIRWAVACWIFAGLSLYCGYLSYEKVIWMLNKQFFDLYNPRFFWTSRTQFWTFVLSVFCLALFVYQGLRQEPK